MAEVKDSCKMLGMLGEKGFEKVRRVYSTEALTPALSTKEDRIKILDTVCIGGLSEHKWGNQYHQQDRVYSSGIFAMCHPANIPDGSYKYIVAMKGRGESNKQKLELNKTENTNSLTTVQKDNLCLEIKQSTKSGSIKCKVGGCYDASYPDSKTRRGRVQSDGDVTPALTAEGSENVNYIETEYRIRKLTPRECWRLMGYTDEDFDKAQGSGVSNSQLYKQAGNAIVKQVLMAIFSNML